MSAEQEHICQIIDQRNRDQSVVFQLEVLQRPPQIGWTGVMVVSLCWESLK